MKTKDNERVSKIHITTYKGYVNFKCRLPDEWIDDLGINKDNREINLTCYPKKNRIIIKKFLDKDFKDLSKKEKQLQIKKFQHLYKIKSDQILLKAIEEYFSISHDIAYRYLQEDISPEELKDVELIDKEHINSKFDDLLKEQKQLQIKKFQQLYEKKFQQKKNLFNAIEEYFSISYRTAYRYLQEDISPEELKDVELIDKQTDVSRNINVMFVNINNVIVPTITIPTNLGVLFLEGKTYEELGIKSAYEIFNENFSIPISMEKIGKKIVINKKN